MNRFAIAALCLAIAVACGPAAKEEESIDAEACEHINDGPSVAVTAGAPSVSEAHKRFDITLIDVTGGKGGSVSYASAAEGDLVIFLSENVPLKVQDSTGAEVAIEATASSGAECTDVKARHTVPVKVGTYALTFGPSTFQSVKLVAEAASHEH